MIASSFLTLQKLKEISVINNEKQHENKRSHLVFLVYL